MGLNIWGWCEGGEVHLGISEGPVPHVLELSRIGIGDADTLYAAVRAQGTAGLATALRTDPVRRRIEAHELVFPLPVSEIWAAGVTYERSRDARRDESQGFDAMYLKVYDAVRPELFFKGTGRRMAGPNETMGIRPDAHWHVPEPELTVILSPDGGIFGFTCGNDLSSRDIEAENPLYLPQAKIFHKSAALGPSVVLAGTADPQAMRITLEIQRDGASVFSGSVGTERMKRTVDDISSYLGIAWPLEPWTALMTGTGIVPPDAFALQDGDEIAIEIDAIGTLRNSVRTIASDWASLG